MITQELQTNVHRNSSFVLCFEYATYSVNGLFCRAVAQFVIFVNKNSNQTNNSMHFSVI